MVNLRGFVLFFCLSSSQGVVVPVKYLGCFQDPYDPGTSQTSEHRGNFNYREEITPMSVHSCVEMCFTDRFKMAALQRGSLCYCGIHTRGLTLLTDEYCFEPCTGNCRQRCGGITTLSVYQTGYQVEPPLHFADWIIRESFVRCYRLQVVWRYCGSQDIKPRLKSTRMTVQVCALYCGSGRTYEQMPISMLIATDECCCSKQKNEAHDAPWGYSVDRRFCSTPCRATPKALKGESTYCVGNYTENGVLEKTFSVWDVIYMKDRGMPTEPRSVFASSQGWFAPTFGPSEEYELKDGIYQYDLDSRLAEWQKRGKRSVNNLGIWASFDNPQTLNNSTENLENTIEDITDRNAGGQPRKPDTQTPASRAPGIRPESPVEFERSDVEIKQKRLTLTSGRRTVKGVMKTTPKTTSRDGVASRTALNTAQSSSLTDQAPRRKVSGSVLWKSKTVQKTALSTETSHSGGIDRSPEGFFSPIVQTWEMGNQITQRDMSDQDMSEDVSETSSRTLKRKVTHMGRSSMLDWMKSVGSIHPWKTKSSSSKLLQGVIQYNIQQRPTQRTKNMEKVVEKTNVFKQKIAKVIDLQRKKLKKVRKKRRTENKTAKRTEKERGWKPEDIENMPELTGRSEMIAKITQPVIDPENSGVKVMDIPEEEDESSSILMVLLGFFVCVFMLIAIGVVLFKKKHPAFMSVMASLRSMRGRKAAAPEEAAAISTTMDTPGTESEEPSGGTTITSTTDDERQPLL